MHTVMACHWQCPPATDSRWCRVLAGPSRHSAAENRARLATGLQPAGAVLKEAPEADSGSHRDDSEEARAPAPTKLWQLVTKEE